MTRRAWLEHTANLRVHATTGITPLSRLAEERLTPLSNQPAYDVTPVLVRQASRDGWVGYAGNAYAVALEYAAQPVLLKLTEQDEVVISTAQGALVARYPLTHTHGAQIGQPARSAPAPALLRPPPAVAAQAAAAPIVEVRSLHEYDLRRGR